MVKRIAYNLSVVLTALLVTLTGTRCSLVHKEADESYQEGLKKYEAGFYEDAVANYLLSVSQGERDERIYADLALAYVKIRENDKAEDAMARALASLPDDPGVLLRAGLYYRELGKPEKAASYFERAAKPVKEKHTSVSLTATGYLAGENMASGEYETAIERYKTLIENSFEVKSSKLFIGECYLRLRQVAAAETYFKWAAEDGLLPADDLYLYRLFQECGEFTKAEQYFAKGLSAITEQKNTSMTVGEYYANAGKFTAAEQYLTDETTYGALSAKAYLATERGEYTEAESYLRTLITNGENLPEVYNRYFILAIRMGDFEKAEQLLTSLRAYRDETLIQTVDWNEIMMYEAKLEYRTAYEKLKSYLTKYGTQEEAERELRFLERSLGS